MVANILPAPGSRVHIALSGGHFFNGTTLFHKTDRWGTYALVLLDCGMVEHCHGLSTNGGIGWRNGANRFAHSPDFKPYLLYES